MINMWLRYPYLASRSPLLESLLQFDDGCIEFGRLNIMFVFESGMLLLE